MAKLKILRGVPGSGKSTFAKNYVSAAETVGDRVRVNRDDLRKMLFDSYFGSDVDELTVTLAQDALVEVFLRNGKDVVLDNTNLRARNVKDSLKLAHKHKAEVSHMDFPVDVDTAVLRDAYRDRTVGADVIKMMFDKFIKKDGSFPDFPVLEEAAYEHEPYVPGNIPAFSFDIDGTLAHMNGRSPYDPSLYHTDTVDTNVRQVLAALRSLGYSIILLSGRSASHRTQTMEWLATHHIEYDELIMRPSSDPHTNDGIVKSYLVDQHISGFYDIIMHFDDRQRVVDALRAKGMKVAQVEPGDF